MKFVNRAKMSVTSGGTSNSIVLGVAPAGFQTFLSAGLQVNDEILYLIEDGLAWEIGKGRLGQSNAVSLLLRDEVLENSQKTTNRLNIKSSGAFVSVIPTAQYFNNVNSRLSSLDSAISITESFRDQAAISANTATTQASIAIEKAEDTAADRIQTGLDVAATAADRIQTGLDVAATAADRIQTGLDASATATDRIQTGLDVAATAADRIQTGLDVVSAANSAFEADVARQGSEQARDLAEDALLNSFWYISDSNTSVTIGAGQNTIIEDPGPSPYDTVTLRIA